MLPGLVGTTQATEAIKLITGLGDPLTGRLLHIDALGMRHREFAMRRDPECVVCGESPSITEPIDYEAFCGVGSCQLPEISVTDLAERLATAKAAPCVLVDVRETDERDVCSIEESVHIPLGEIADRLGELDATAETYIHCKAGGRSAKAVAILRESGFGNVFNVAGGMDAWQELHAHD